MNTKNLTQAELDRQKKKRKYNEISKGGENEAPEVKEPEKKMIIKECPFNPFGEESCDMCGA